nr:hypothetical protein [Tanacetum cinerariifolium]
MTPVLKPILIFKLDPAVFGSCYSLISYLIVQAYKYIQITVPLSSNLTSFMEPSNTAKDAGSGDTNVTMVDFRLLISGMLMDNSDLIGGGGSMPALEEAVMSLNEFHEDENIRILVGRPIMVAAMADVSSSICCLLVYDDLLMLTAFFCDSAVFGKTERQDFYRPQCVTPPNEPWTEYVSG